MSKNNNLSRSLFDISRDYAIGIDFGTTKSAIAFEEVRASQGGRHMPRGISLNRTGAEFMPSIVYIRENGDPIIGEDALSFRFKRNYIPANLFSSFKLDLGKSVLPVKYDNLKIQPVQLAYLILKELKHRAENIELTQGEGIKYATITIPSNWSQERKADTKKAAMAAGFSEPINFIREPHAALLNIDPDRITGLHDRKRNYMIVDYGGGTCDVAVCKLKPGTLLSQDPDIVEVTQQNCGGLQIDIAFAHYIINRATSLLNIGTSTLQKNIDSIILEAEQEKIDFVEWLNGLTGTDNVIKISNFFDGKPLEFELSEEEFTEIVKPQIEIIKKPIEQVLKKAMIDKNEINYVFIVGGSSLLPVTKEVVAEIFPSNIIERVPKPRHQVVYGAAIWQSLFLRGKLLDKHMPKQYNALSLVVERRKNIRKKIRNLFIRDRASNNFSTKTLVEKDSPLREAMQKKVITVKTPHDNMTSIDIIIMEGEFEGEFNDLDKIENENYAKRKLEFGKPVPKNSKIEIEYFIDKQDMLILNARLTDFGQPITIVGRASITTDEIEKIKNRFKN
ncbi:MAG: Hsp70 family protein [Candidatus Lokiarchaeota archaeon]|nr:Hsp70 family protein [Candidatus Lokiarchaeota archaeon]